MKLTTSRFGEIEIDESKVITFIEYLPGFQGCKRFVLIDHNPDSPFKWLQSVEDGKLAFVVIDPVMVVTDYEPEIAESDLTELNLQKHDKVFLLCIVNISRDCSQVTVNLLGPLAINPEQKCGKQIIALNTTYSIRYDITSACQKQQQDSASNSHV